jgi:hypothetical protein
MRNCTGVVPIWPFGRQPFAGILATACLALFLAACAIRLAPAYDQTIVSGLDAANEEAMVLFASVANGTSAGTFSKREAAYDSVIGKIDALRVTAQARPEPGGKLFGKPAAGEVATFESPTPEILAAAAEPLVFMRDTDRSEGLTTTIVEGVKRSFEIQIAQALTYEKALQR